MRLEILKVGFDLTHEKKVRVTSKMVAWIDDNDSGKTILGLGQETLRDGTDGS